MCSYNLLFLFLSFKVVNDKETDELTTMTLVQGYTMFDNQSVVEELAEKDKFKRSPQELLSSSEDFLVILKTQQPVTWTTFRYLYTFDNSPET